MGYQDRVKITFVALFIPRTKFITINQWLIKRGPEVPWAPWGTFWERKFGDKH